MRVKVLVGLLLLAPLAAAAAFAQQQSSFRTAVDLITVDVRVSDGSGNPVAGLRPEEFAIKVDGRPRRPVSAQFVDYSFTSERGAVEGAAASARPTRAMALPRTVFILVDESNIRAGMAKFAAEAARGFIDRMRPEDRVGLLTLPFTSTRLEATTDRGPVKQALGRITGHLGSVATPLAQERSVGLSEAFALERDSRTWAQVVTRECLEKKGGQNPDRPGEPARECVNELEQLAHALVADARQRTITAARSLSEVIDASATISGLKTFILLSQELSVPNTLAERKDFESETASLARAAARAQANVYVLQLDAPAFNVEDRLQPPTAGADADARSFGLEAVTTLTGGRRLMISGRAEPAFERIARETSATYLLAFDAEAGDRDGKPHVVTVSTTRPGAEVRARRLFAFPQQTASAASAPPTPRPNPAEQATAMAAVGAPSVAAPSTAVSDAGGRQDPAQPASTAPVPTSDRQIPTGAKALEEVVRRMGQYVAAYGERTALIVASEKYTQRVSMEDGTNFPPREILAEFAIVKVAGSVGWIGFRDVVEVNGERQTDRRERLLRLLTDANGDVTEARRISNESARYNIGPISRNFNVPTTTLFFFHPANLERFSFKRKGTKRIENVETWVLEFKETRRPSMVMTRDGKDVPCEGTVWVSPSDGTIVRTLITFRGFADDKAMQAVRDKSSQNSSFPSGSGDPSAAGASRPAQPSTPQPPSPAPSTPPTPAQQPAGGPGQAQTKSSGASVRGGDDAPSNIRSSGLTPQEALAGSREMRRFESLARIDVTYARHDRFNMWLPSKMSELYEGPIPRGAQPPFMGQATTTADYTEFKQFSTSAKVTAPK